MQRRNLLKALPFAAGAAALQATAAAHDIETPWQKATRLSDELAEALERIDGAWSAEVFGDGRAMHAVFRDATTQIDAEWQLRQSADAIRGTMQHVAPGQEYIVVINGVTAAFAMSFHADGSKDRKIELGAAHG